MKKLAKMNPAVQPDTGNLLEELRGLIEQARQRVAVTINREMTLLYWNIGSVFARTFCAKNAPRTVSRLCNHWLHN